VPYFVIPNRFSGEESASSDGVDAAIQQQIPPSGRNDKNSNIGYNQKAEVA
jgi:hypothetical protein